MGTSQSNPIGPDLALGIAGGDLADGGMLVGHVGAEARSLRDLATNSSALTPAVRIMADLWRKG